MVLSAINDKFDEWQVTKGCHNSPITLDKENLAP